MQHLNFFKKRVCSLATLLVMFMFLCGNLHAADITHNISSGSLTIPGGSADNYIITGTTTTNSVVIKSGYKGTVTLKDLSVTLTSGSTSPFLIEGKDNCSNYEPVTNVNIVLDGDNKLVFHGSIAAAMQVNQGAQINISAIEPSNNASGKLHAQASQYYPGSTSTPQSGGAAIGAPNSSIAQGSSDLYNTNGTLFQNNAKTAGGNIIINSGTITAWGAHGAGIGGGYLTWYNGIIIVTGGVVEARAGRHAAGLGSGCPTGAGVMPYFADKSAIIALPPCQITAYGSTIGDQVPSLGLAGTKFLTYVNDPAKPLITIHTEGFEKNANIYLDLTETPGLQNIFDKVDPTFDLTHVWIGKTATSDGLMKVHGLFQDITTFFTDASSSAPATFGRPYMPVSKTTSAAETIILPLFEANISFTDYPSVPLTEGYPAAQAEKNAYCLKIEYNDDLPLTGLTYKLQQEAASSFKNLVFLASDSTTKVSAPTTLNKGDVYYIVTPLKDGKLAGAYTDVILIHGTYKAIVMAGYIRRISDQMVVKDDTETNSHIKVTAAPATFTEIFPTSKTVALTLNITHAGISGVPYNPADVKAKYIITTEPSYDAALAATPHNQWSDLTIPSADGSNAATTVPFAGKAAGTYYIHWYVVSGVVMAHSKDVTDPARNYGGFGKYNIIAKKTVTYNGNTNNSGAVPVDATVYVTGDSVVVIGNTGNLKKTDATFIGWSFGVSTVVTTPAEEPADLMVANDTFKIVTDTTLYAVWAIDKKGPNGGGDSIPDYLQFAVTYNGNGNTSGTAPTDANLYSNTDNVIAKAHGSLAKTGGTHTIVFAGWTPTPVSNVLTSATAADTTTAFVRAGGVFTITANTTMYAVWSTDINDNGNPDVFETGYKVTYHANGATTGTVPSDTASYLSGMSAIAKAKGNLAKDNAIYLGWSKSPVGVVTTAAQEAAANIIQTDSAFVISDNISLYAVWAEDLNGPGGGSDSIPDYKQFGVTYNNNGATGSVVDNYIYTSGTSVTLKTKGNLTRTNFAFLGWNPSLTSDVTNQAQEDALTAMKQPDETFVITANTTWYAVWGADNNGNEIPDYKEKKITFDWGMLDGIEDTLAVAKGSTVKLTDMGFNAPYFVFMGWHTKMMPILNSLMMETIVRTSATFYAVGDPLLISDNITLHAVWAYDTNNDGFPDYGGSVIKPKLKSVSTLSGISEQEVSVFSDSTTGNEILTGARVWSYANTLHIQSDKAVRANIYTLSGRLFKQLNVAEGLTSEPLERGIYVVEINGSRYKVAIK